MNQTQLWKRKRNPTFNQISRRRGCRAGLCARLLLALLLPSCLPAFGVAEVSPTNSPAIKTEETTSPELRTYLQLQEQIHAAQLSIERTRKEAAELSAQNNEALATRLQAIEQALSAQRARELEAMQSSNREMQSSNRVMLTVAGAFAGMGFVAMLLMGYFQWKTINRLAEISTALPAPTLQLGAAHPLTAIGPGTSPVVMSVPVEAGNSSLLESIQRLEQRLHELEVSGPQLQHSSPAPEPTGEVRNGGPANGTTDSETAREAARTTVLLNKGQALLNTDKTEEALECFESVLALDPRNAEALVKKGTALEKLRKLNEAIECYDQAIAADGTMTIAYLYKGGVFNRMEKFSEALECYEQALRTQEKRRA